MAEPVTIGRTVIPPPRVVSRQAEHRFFLAMALTFLLLVFIGFAPSYYLRPLFTAQPLTPLQHIHGFIASLWCVLFLSQTALINTRRLRAHRLLGVAGVVLAMVLVGIGYLTAIQGARLAHGPPSRDPIRFLAIPMTTLLVFTVLLIPAVLGRRERDMHKRLMVLATIAIMGPALARLGMMSGIGGPLTLSAGMILLVLVCFAWDRGANGRIHPAFLWGGLLVMITAPLRYVIARSDWWYPIARRLAE